LFLIFAAKNSTKRRAVRSPLSTMTAGSSTPECFAVTRLRFAAREIVIAVLDSFMNGSPDWSNITTFMLRQKETDIKAQKLGASWT
jgi:hypothetical protein